VSGAVAAFLDRDGVINELVEDPDSGQPESPLQVEDVSLIPGATAGLRRLAGAGLLLVGVSNQPAAAKAKVSLEQLMAVQRRVVALVEDEGVRFDGFHICWHHPEGTVAELSGGCDCRKPAPGMLLDAANQLGIDLVRSWMIGDTDADVLAGQSAGCQTVLIEHRASAHKREGDVRPVAVASTLAAAVELLLGSPVD
jgi:D-glycero-D-manno-heptose 1,7-bisphosphate phosphatase